MGDAQHLMLGAQLREQRADAIGRATADARIDLVEDQHAAGLGAAQRVLQRQEDARQLATRRYATQRARRLARIRRETKLGLLRAAWTTGQAVGGDHGFQRHFEAGAREVETRERRFDGARQPLGGRCATGREFRGVRDESFMKLLRFVRQCAHPLVAAGDGRQLGSESLTTGDQFVLAPAVLGAQALEQRESLFDRSQALGIDLDAVRVALEIACGIGQLGGGRAQSLGLRAQRRVELRERFEATRGCVDAVDRADIFGLQRIAAERRGRATRLDA